MRLLDRFPLRVLLVAATVALVALGLVGSGVAVTLTMRAQLINTQDQKLREAMSEWASTPPPRPHESFIPEEANRQRPPSQFFVAVRTSSGQLLFEVDDSSTSPTLPDQVALRQPFDLPDSDGEGEWRALADMDSQGNITVLAVPLDSTVDSTVVKLVQVQALVGIIILAGVGTCAWILVRRSLRPLQEVESAAHEIAEGNFDRRLPDVSPHTEVGSLAQSFNWMASRIESAFAATEASRQKAADSEDRMRTFVADAGHELRTPLTSIIGFAELYRKRMIPDADAAFDRIEPEAKRMHVLIEDLLTLARLDAERPMAHEQVDLPHVAADAVAGARAIEQDRDVALRVDAAPVVTGDPGRLRQVALNLVVNALRHAGPGAAVTVRVTEALASTAEHSASVGPTLRPGTRVGVLEVDDDGVGMDPETAAKSFERFHRADDSRTRADGAGGSGLGLAIVAGIVEAHGGAVHLDTAPGRGARFRVEIPLDGPVDGNPNA
ncbi:sensor histidine kinase [Dietzia sp.]|uniref:sensor histidine kinase n=1 Tax=Dietzia sp. TaxID=1871616 RepID=UPI002FD8D4B5